MGVSGRRAWDRPRMAPFCRMEPPSAPSPVGSGERGGGGVMYFGWVWVWLCGGGECFLYFGCVEVGGGGGVRGPVVWCYARAHTHTYTHIYICTH